MGENASALFFSNLKLMLDIIEDCITHCVQQSTNSMDIHWAILVATYRLGYFYLSKGAWVGCLGVHYLLEHFWIHNPIDLASWWLIMEPEQYTVDWEIFVIKNISLVAYNDKN